jgi:hypothetical protein
MYVCMEAMHSGAALCLCVLLLEMYLSSGQLPKVLQNLQSNGSQGVHTSAIRHPST